MMKQVRAIIAEDEPILALALQNALKKCWPTLQIEAVASNGIDAIQHALALQPDILFLDIKMPGKNGIEVVQELAEDWPEKTHFPLIVYVTAYDEFALAAFEQAASDYLLKPISEERLEKTIQRLQTKLSKPQARSDELDHLIEQLRQFSPAFNVPSSANTSNEKLSLIRAAVGNQIRLIPMNEVIYFEASDKYINVVTAQHASLIRMSLRELLPQLDTNVFWQVHRSTIVNNQYIQTATREETGKFTLKLRDCNDRLQVSRVYAHLFRQM
jgi:DNA-binding LytR/AlgR family response regulator